MCLFLLPVPAMTLHFVTFPLHPFPKALTARCLKVDNMALFTLVSEQLRAQGPHQPLGAELC